MKWERLGRIFVAEGQRPWIASHSSVPTPEHLGDDLFRIYFTPRNSRGHSNVSCLVIDLKEPTRVLEICSRPCLEPGPEGAFDGRGAMGTSIVATDARRLLYYIGWAAGEGPLPWHVSIGLADAALRDAEPVFDRVSPHAIMATSSQDPFFVTNPFVLREGNRWTMWYSTGTPWKPAEPRYLPRYHIASATSRDGRNWQPTGRPCITAHFEGETAISRPWVVLENGIYRMWYSFRGDAFGYRIGYAESSDGITWSRHDSDGFQPSGAGWDSDAVAYPAIIDHSGRRYMLYCGNGYSREGFGIAVSA